MNLTVNKAVTEENKYRRCHTGGAGPQLGEASILTITKCRKEEPVREARPCDTFPVAVRTVSLNTCSVYSNVLRQTYETHVLDTIQTMSTEKQNSVKTNK